MNPIQIRLDMDEAITRMGDREIYLEIARYFAAELPNAVRAMEEALARGDLPTLARLAHSCKSNCAGVGAEEERERCLELERAGRAGDAGRAGAALDELKLRLSALAELLAGLG